MDIKKFVEAYVELQSNDCRRHAWLKRNNNGTIEMYIPGYGSITRPTYNSLAASIIDYEMHKQYPKWKSSEELHIWYDMNVVE